MKYNDYVKVVSRKMIFVLKFSETLLSVFKKLWNIMTPYENQC